MAVSFESARHKLERSKKHIAELQVGEEAFFSDKPYAVVTEEDPATGEDIRKIKFTKRVPSSLSSIVSDAANNLRDALDHVGYSVSVASGNVRPKNAAFPFAGSADQLDNACGRSKDIPNEIIALFRAFKPYRGGNDLLWALNHVANSHKHAMLSPMAIASLRNIYIERVVGGGLSIPGSDIGWDRTKNEIEVFRTDKRATVEHNFQVRLFIAFDEMEVIGGQPVVPVLNAFAREVERILLAVEAECSRLGL